MPDTLTASVGKITKVTADKPKVRWHYMPDTEAALQIVRYDDHLILCPTVPGEFFVSYDLAGSDDPDVRCKVTVGGAKASGFNFVGLFASLWAMIAKFVPSLATTGKIGGGAGIGALLLWLFLHLHPTPPVPPLPPVPPTPIPTPQPQPQPDPPRPSPSPAPILADGLRVLFVYESSDALDPKSILFSQKVRQYLNAKCTKGPDGKQPEWRQYDKDITPAKLADESKLWQDAMSLPRTESQWLIVSNGRTGYSGPMPTKDPDELIAFISKYEK